MCAHAWAAPHAALHMCASTCLQTFPVGECLPTLEPPLHAHNAHPHPPCPLSLQAGALPNAKGAHGNTALHQAAAGGHTACIKALIDSKAAVDVHAADGCTPLHRAAANGAYRLGPEGTAWRPTWFVAPCKPHSVGHARG